MKSLSPPPRIAKPAPDTVQAVRAAQLRYVTDTIPGIERRKQGKGFGFVGPNGKRPDRAALKRIRHLVIPPAWTSVWISPYENGHIQATGRDDKARKQYIYHPDWHTVRNETKFDQLIDFAKALPAIRRRVARDLKLKGLPRDKVLAAVVRLLDATHIRVGNPEYARQNDSFGLSTMRNRHVKVRGHTMQFRFRGKSGKDHEIELADKRLARIVKGCLDLPGYELFQYVNNEGEVCNATSGDVNDYLREISAVEFTAKHFRTWAGTVHAAQICAAQSSEKPTKKDIVACIDGVAQRLGNTRSVCRKYYIHPAVLDSFTAGEIAGKFNSSIPHRVPRTGLNAAEKAVLKLLKTARRNNLRAAKRSRNLTDWKETLEAQRNSAKN